MGAGRIAVRGLVLLIVLGLAAPGVAPMLTRPPIADLSRRLCVADRVLHGARYGVDVIETTPPLIVWLKMPAVLLARAAGLRPIAAFAGELLLIAAGTGLLAIRLHRHLRPRPIARLHHLRVAEVPASWSHQPGSWLHLVPDPADVPADPWRIHRRLRRGLYA
jgi:hypothetical protein